MANIAAEKVRTARYAKSNDVTIYETEYLTNTNLQETCELKQPFICKSNDFKSSSISNNSSTELKVKDCTSKNTNEYIMLSSYRLIHICLDRFGHLGN